MQGLSCRDYSNSGWWRKGDALIVLIQMDYIESHICICWRIISEKWSRKRTIEVFTEKYNERTIMESSHSGLVRHLGKVVYPKGYRGFKSLTLRKNWKSESEAEMGSRRRRDPNAFPPRIPEFKRFFHAPRGSKKTVRKRHVARRHLPWIRVRPSVY